MNVPISPHDQTKDVFDGVIGKSKEYIHKAIAYFQVPVIVKEVADKAEEFAAKARYKHKVNTFSVQTVRSALEILRKKGYAEVNQGMWQLTKQAKDLIANPDKKEVPNKKGKEVQRVDEKRRIILPFNYKEGDFVKVEVVNQNEIRIVKVKLVELTGDES